MYHRMLLTQPYEAQFINEETDFITDLHMHNTQVYSFLDTCTCVGSSNVRFLYNLKFSAF